MHHYSRLVIGIGIFLSRRYPITPRPCPFFTDLDILILFFCENLSLLQNLDAQENSNLKIMLLQMIFQLQNFLREQFQCFLIPLETIEFYFGLVMSFIMHSGIHPFKITVFVLVQSFPTYYKMAAHGASLQNFNN